MPSTKYLRLHTLLQHQTLSCIDGRKDTCTLGVPGGNMGVFLVMLSALSRLDTNRQMGLALGDEEIQRYLHDYVLHLGAFLMHTDAQALGELCAQMSWSDCTSQRIMNAPRHLQDRLLMLLTQEQALGCGHLRLMFVEPEDYLITRSLLQGALKAFFRLVWRAHPQTQGLLEYHTLHGHHQEQELVHYYAMEPASTLRGDVSLSMDCTTDGSSFAFHEPAYHYMIEHSVTHASSWFGLSPEDEQILGDLAHDSAQLHLEATRAKLLPDVPVRTTLCTLEQEVV
jgi:hypothetical protein